MKKSGTYGDHLTLVAMASVYGVQWVVLLSTDQSQHCLVSTTAKYDPAVPIAVLGYNSESLHYVSLNMHQDTMLEICSEVRGMELYRSSVPQASGHSGQTCSVVNSECHTNVGSSQSLPGDVATATHVDAEFGDSEPYQPKLTTYPRDKHARAFNKCYFDTFPWMEYSPTNNAAYCFPCRVYGADSHYRESFVNRGFTSWSNILVRANDHAKSDYHLSAACRCECAKQTAA